MFFPFIFWIFYTLHMIIALFPIQDESIIGIDVFIRYVIIALRPHQIHDVTNGGVE